MWDLDSDVGRVSRLGDEVVGVLEVPLLLASEGSVHHKACLVGTEKVEELLQHAFGFGVPREDGDAVEEGALGRHAEVEGFGVTPLHSSPVLLVVVPLVSIRTARESKGVNITEPCPAKAHFPSFRLKLMLMLLQRSGFAGRPGRRWTMVAGSGKG